MFVAAWSWPGLIAAPTGKNDDDAGNKSKRDTTSINRPANINRSINVDQSVQQNIQPSRVPVRNSAPQFGVPSAQSVARPQASFVRPPLASDGKAGLNFQRELPMQSKTMQGKMPPSSFDQTRGALDSPKLIFTADTNKSDDQTKTKGNQAPVRQEIRQQIQPRIQSNNAAGLGQTNPNFRSGGATGKSITSGAGGDYTPPPPGNLNLKSGAGDVRQRFQGGLQQGNKAIGTDKININPNLGKGAASGGSSTGNATGPTFQGGTGAKSGMDDVRRRFQGGLQDNKTTGSDKTILTNPFGKSGGASGATTLGPTGPSAKDKITDQLQNNALKSGSSISDVQKRLGGKEGLKDIQRGDLSKGISDKGGLGISGKGGSDKSDKADTGLGKVKGAPGGIATDSGKGLDATSKDAKQRLGIDNLERKRGGVDLKGGDAKGADLKGGDLDLNKKDLDLNKKDLGLGKKVDGPSLKGPGGNAGLGITAKDQPYNVPKIGRDEMLKARFPDRLKSGELDKVTKGDIAQKLKLSDQFHMMQQGDVARRLELQKHAIGAGVKNVRPVDIHIVNNVNRLHSVNDYYAFHPHFYHGVVSPIYTRSCFKFVYFGPSFFAGAVWYPYWNPWVAWSWHYRCHPIWDPRPLWCRPIIYDPYYNWVWWQTPVWISLPAVSCGTWVDVQMPVVPPAQYDLQLLAVRFVDPGHPEEKLGPRYRLWLRNNSNQPIVQPFSVMLFAGNDNRLTDDLPRAGVRVKSMDPGDVQSVDIRLPVEVGGMWRDADGNPAPFKVLHALVDANREISETTLTNNGAAIQREEVLPVDPAAFEVDPASLPAGGEMILAGEGLGPQPGQVLVNVAGRELPAEVQGWYDLGVKFNVPQIEVAAPTPAEVIVVRGDGAATNPVKITLLPGQAGPVLNPPPPPPAL